MIFFVCVFVEQGGGWGGAGNLSDFDNNVILITSK